MIDATDVIISSHLREVFIELACPDLKGAALEEIEGMNGVIDACHIEVEEPRKPMNKTCIYALVSEKFDDEALFDMKQEVLSIVYEPEEMKLEA